MGSHPFPAYKAMCWLLCPFRSCVGAGVLLLWQAVIPPPLIDGHLERVIVRGITVFLLTKRDRESRLQASGARQRVRRAQATHAASKNR